MKTKPRFRSRNQNKLRSRPTLRFSPTAWAKLLFLRDRGETEIGAFGVSVADDPLLVEDLALLRQRCSFAGVIFDDAAVADHFDRQVDLGRLQAQFARIWIHTHPGHCPLPSLTDEATFARSFGAADWAVMFILARGGRSYCRLRFAAGPGGELEIGCAVDYHKPFGATDYASWGLEYLANVETEFVESEPYSREEPVFFEDEIPPSLRRRAAQRFASEMFDSRDRLEGFVHDDRGELFEERR